MAGRAPPATMRPMQPAQPQDAIRLAAVGDLLMIDDPASGRPARRESLVDDNLHRLLGDCDVVFANLECTLSGDGKTVPTEPRVVASAEQVRRIRAAGVTVVTLANNHMFDCMQAGFHALRDLLDELGIAHFGAGDDLDQAAAPAIVEARGCRFAFLAGVDERSGPSRLAAPGQYGVAPLDMDRLTHQIAELSRTVDHGIVSLHWGEERFNIPSPGQIAQARALIDAGASMVLGHHPHVLQGLERHRDRPILYSLGNFLADPVPFSDGDTMHWNRTERVGCILLADLSPTGITNTCQVPTHDDGLAVVLDRTGFGDRRLARVNRALARGVTLARYRREHFRVKTVRPALAHLRWSKLRALGPRKLLRALCSACSASRAD